MLKFDENGKVIPRITKEEARHKIQQNLAEYNSDVKVHNLTVRLVEALAAVKVFMPDTKSLPNIDALLSPELKERVECQVLVIQAKRKIGVRYDSSKISKNVAKILEALEEGAVQN